MTRFASLPGSKLTRFGCCAAVAASALAMSSAPASAAPAAAQPLAVVAKDYRYLGVPLLLPAGQYNLQFSNHGHEEHEFVALNLGPTCSQSINNAKRAKRLLSSVQSEEEFVADCPGATFAGAADAQPGARDREPLNLEPGRTLYFCAVPDANGTPHFDLGMIGLIKVFGPRSAP